LVDSFPVLGECQYVPVQYRVHRLRV
jgi:hypothetical protein